MPSTIEPDRRSDAVTVPAAGEQGRRTVTERPVLGYCCVPPERGAAAGLRAAEPQKLHTPRVRGERRAASGAVVYAEAGGKDSRSPAGSGPERRGRRWFRTEQRFVRIVGAAESPTPPSEMALSAPGSPRLHAGPALYMCCSLRSKNSVTLTFSKVKQIKL